MNLIKCLDRLFFGKRAYMTNVKPCPCRGSRHILFEPLFHLSEFASFVCDDCGFSIGDAAEDLLRKWEKLPRNKEDNHD